MPFLIDLGIVSWYASDTKGGVGNRGTLIEIAGIALHTSDSDNNLTDSMKRTEKHIAALRESLVREETRYWSQFTAMESAIERLNQQSAMLTQQFTE